uniref:Serine/threonine-protein kinase PLK n=1 Tax=Strongyloides papillosus TaxID=174720 RepID=A0A0N5BQG7_STREA
MSDRRGVQKEVPSKIVDRKNGKIYNRGIYLGRGGFARCYEFIDSNSGETVAGKVVAKTLLTKRHQKDKMTQEIEIQKSLSHENVVKMYDYFEDSDNVYVLLELCPRRSLMELHKRRKAVTEPEARYFTKQIVNGLIYLHGRNIIHRDLKLGNLFLSELMDVKIGDFGLATVVETDGERKKTLCGTPNYIAPEMLDKRGHSFEVDIWAVGCILYTLLVGKPPFETLTLKDTYDRIKSNNYTVPSIVSSEAKHLIRYLLHSDPAQRPHATEIFKYNFFNGFVPPRLPTSCLTMAPKFCNSPARQEIRTTASSQQNIPPRVVLGPKNHQTPPIPRERDDWYLGELSNQLQTLLNSKIQEISLNEMDEALHPASTPVFFISKWVDYSDKYGLGYQLSDNSVGVLFNDSTKLVLDAAGEQIQYCERNNSEHYFTMSDFPPSLEKKVTLLKYFRRYMRDHLVRAVATVPREGDELARLPVLRTWFRTKAAIVLHLTNGTLQINFFSDHVKLIVCPHMGAVSFIDPEKNLRTYKFEFLPNVGCEPQILRKIQYTKHIVDRMLNPCQSLSGNNRVDYTAIEAAHAPDVRTYRHV